VREIEFTIEAEELGIGIHDVLSIRVCGIAECGPVAARIEVTEATVTWSHWRTGTPDRDVPELGTFVFNRNRYEEALQRTSSPVHLDQRERHPR